MQVAIQARDKKYSRSSPWYMMDDWFTYSETELVNRDPQSAAEANEEQASGAAHSSTDARSEDTTMKECYVCHEKFEEYWVDEEDAWKLRDCLVENGKAFHSYCKSDIRPSDAATATEGGDAGEGDTMPFMEDEGLPPPSVNSDPDSDPLSLVKNVLEMASGTSPVVEESSVIGGGDPAEEQASSSSGGENPNGTE